ncbi:MAG: NADP-dependent malic enzyme [Tissierellia bacterium]|nr:NADP-dependent malic enzyme [Tissierellia bacterium]
MNIYEKALKAHGKWQGKISTELKMPLDTKEDLSLAYTPGVAEACREIAKDEKAMDVLTWKKNTVAVITDGSAVLGLGNIGAKAAMPVMEGKCALFKRFADINAVPLLLDTQDPDEIVNIIKNIAPTFGGINLEDISSPRCVAIEEALIDALDIPVFHDDQHGTAIVVIAALINALKIVHKKAEEITITLSGAGAAGYAIARMLNQLGVYNIYAFHRPGILSKNEESKYDDVKKEIARITNHGEEILTMEEAMAKSDVFIGVSGPNLIDQNMVRSMKKDPIIFAMANPDPEISYEKAKEAGARVVGTGRSDYPNQINNVLAFPGLFKGALRSGAKKITETMKMAAAKALADLVDDEELEQGIVIPSVFNFEVAEQVAKKVEAEVK